MAASILALTASKGIPHPAVAGIPNLVHNTDPSNMPHLTPSHPTLPFPA